jgi:hypothetical protein
MHPTLAHVLADTVLAVHAGVVLFNVFWLLAIPLGGLLGWRFVRAFWWRVSHLFSLAVVAIQPLLGRYCFLTLWQEEFASIAGPTSQPNLFERILTAIVFWPLPPWIFVYLYVAAVLWTALMWWLVPPRLARAARRQDTAAR